MKHLRRVVIKEELVALTQDFLEAIILNQMIYWSQRIKDFDQFIEEEKNRRPHDSIDIRKSKGWIYKTAEDLHGELMLEKSFSRPTVARRLDSLVKKGYIDKRKGKSFNKANQYRLNIRFIQHELHNLGYILDGYPLPDISEKKPIDSPIVHDEQSNNQSEHPTVHSEHSNVQCEQPIVQNERSIYTEITSKTTSKTIQNKQVGLCSQNSIQDVINFLNKTTNAEFRSTSPENKKLITELINRKYSLDDMKAVIKIKMSQWLADPQKQQWLRPKTLFNTDNFEGYLQEAIRNRKKAITPESSKQETKVERIKRLNYAAALYKSKDKGDYLEYIKTHNFTDKEIKIVEASE